MSVRKVLVVDLEDLDQTGARSGSDEELLAVDEEDTIAGESTEPHLRPGEVSEDAHGPTQFGRDGSDPVVALECEIK